MCVGPVERMCTNVTSAGEREGGVRWRDGLERERGGGRAERKGVEGMRQSTWCMEGRERAHNTGHCCCNVE